MHVLFSEGQEVSMEISKEAILAAICFVQLCCQQTAFMAGRGDITQEIEIFKSSKLDIFRH
jgi:hypothetical protein